VTSVYDRPGQNRGQNAEILVHFSRKRIEVNTASCKRTTDKVFETLGKFATMLQNAFLEISLNWIYLALKLAKK
jgi:hypothetical protein